MKCLRSTRGNKTKALVNEIKCVMTGERRNRVKNREKSGEIISSLHPWKVCSWALWNQEESEHKHSCGSGAQIFCLILLLFTLQGFALFWQDLEEQAPSAPVGCASLEKSGMPLPPIRGDRSHSASLLEWRDFVHSSGPGPWFVASNLKNPTQQRKKKPKLPTAITFPQKPIKDLLSLPHSHEKCDCNWCQFQN